MGNLKPQFQYLKSKISNVYPLNQTFKKKMFCQPFLQQNNAHEKAKFAQNKNDKDTVMVCNKK